MNKVKIIFFGNGLLAEAALSVLEKTCEIVFHAHTKEDLEEVLTIKQNDTHHEIHGVLASYGVIIKKDVLDLFEPEGILNIHPSMLPDLRGPSPIETAILRGDTTFGVSIMKLAPAMDAGPIYYQQIVDSLEIDPNFASPNIKKDIYNSTATFGAEWITEHLASDTLPPPVAQDGTKASFCQKLEKTMSILDPERESSSVILRKINALSGWPKSKFEFFGHECIIHAAHLANIAKSPDVALPEFEDLSLRCSDGKIIFVDILQPSGKKPMDSKSFLNGYKH